LVVCPVAKLDLWLKIGIRALNQEWLTVKMSVHVVAMTENKTGISSDPISRRTLPSIFSFSSISRVHQCQAPFRRQKQKKQHELNSCAGLSYITAGKKMAAPQRATWHFLLIVGLSIILPTAQGLPVCGYQGAFGNTFILSSMVTPISGPSLGKFYVDEPRGLMFTTWNSAVSKYLFATDGDYSLFVCKEGGAPAAWREVRPRRKKAQI
jgi:hypothetical protein